MGMESIFKLSLIMNMIDNLTGPMVRVNSTVDGSVSKLQGMQQSFGDMTKTGASMAGIGAQITDAALAPVAATFETKRALGELSAMGVKDLKTLEEAGKSFSNTWAGTTKAEFLSAAIDIKGGIDALNEEGIAKYTELSGITAKATSATIGEMTSLFATGYGIYKDFYSDLSDIQFGEIFSAGIAQAILTFKASGSSMAQSITALGGAATSANVPLEEQLSVLGMLQATMSGSESGTKYRAFLRTAAKAGKDLGLSFLDANKQLKSMPEILGVLKSKYGETLDAMEKRDIQTAFGSDEAVALIDLMYSKTGDLQKNILTLYDSMGKGTAVTEEMAAAINRTEPEQYKILQQRIQSIKESIGNSLLPTVNQVFAKSSDILTKLDDWIGKNQELVKVIMLVVLAIGGFLTVAGTTIAVVSGVGLVFTKTAGLARGMWTAFKALPGLLDTIYLKALYAGDGLKKGFGTVKTLASSAVTGIKNVAASIGSMARTAAINGATALKNMAVGLAGMARQAITTAVTAMPGLIASVWAFTAALLANPVTWIIVGIVALVAAIILLWRNWDSVVAWIKGVWDGFVNGIKAGFKWITNLFSGMPVWLQVAIAAFAPFIGIPLLIITHWSAIKEFFKGVFQLFKESGAKIIDTLVDGIKSAAMKPVQAVKNIFAKVRELLPFSDAHEGPLSQLTLSGHRTMSTIAEGIMTGEDLPAEAIEGGLSKVDATIGRKPVNKINLREATKQKDTNEMSSADSKQVIIQKLLFNVDFSKIKELPQLLKLIKEIEDYTNSNGLVAGEV